jgi:Putative TM nitroreductase
MVEGKVMEFSKSIDELVKIRCSVRSYSEKPIDNSNVEKINSYINNIQIGPFGNRVRFKFFQLNGMDNKKLKGFGTYGLIKNPKYFIGAVVSKGDNYLLDFGYQFEKVVLFLTDMGLATCWLGGTFKGGSFAKAMDIKPNEEIPCVTPLGYDGGESKRSKILKTFSGSKERKQWDKLFFKDEFGSPLHVRDAGRYAKCIDLVRMAPSASNKQPWRILQKNQNYHFYMARDPFMKTQLRFINKSDLQPVDMGIAFSHFEMSAVELGLKGKWMFSEPELLLPKRVEYVVTWVGEELVQ